MEEEQNKIEELLSEINLCVPQMQLSLYENFGIFDLCSEIVMSKGTAASSDIHNSESVLQMLMDEKKALLHDVIQSKEAIERAKIERNWVAKSIEDMTKIMSSATVQKPMDNNYVENIQANLRRRFREEKARLKDVLKCIFPEDIKTQNLLANVVNHYFLQGPGNYFEVEKADGMEESITTLARACICEVNPSDPYQIRIIDME